MRRATEAHPLVIRAESVRLSPAAIEELAEEIAADAVDGLLQESVDGYFARAFTTIALAALHRGIPVDARHLVDGARLLPDPGLIAKLSANMTGDVVGGLVDAVVDGRLSLEREAVSLFLAAHWSRERGLDARRPEIVRRTRMCARGMMGPEAEPFVAAAADVLGDDELSGLIDRLPVGMLRPMASRLTEALLEITRRPILEDLEDEDDLAPSAMRRRAVARVGRNEPCPCGSGKKYKRCCAAKDEERLRDSSDIAGVTRAELRLHLEEHLSLERVFSLRTHELARLDPRRIEPGLYGAILNRLILFEEFDAVRDFFEAVGDKCNPGHCLDAVDAALRAARPDAARTLLQTGPPLEGDLLGFGPRLLMEGSGGRPALDLLEDEARHDVDGAAVDVACDLLRSRWPCVGILIARGVAPLANPWDREVLLEELGRARDQLDLPARDPTEGMEDVWGWGEDLDVFDPAPVGPEADRGAPPPPPPPDHETERRLGEKEAELARLRQDLSDLHRKLEERQQGDAEAHAGISPTTEAAPGDPRVDRLKERVDRLRSELSQRHAERNQLRRQLERTLKRVDTLEAQRESASTSATAETDDDSDTAPDDPPMAPSFRIPVFGPRCRDSLESAPDPVRRRAVIVASRIAAGDESAFRGSRRLRVHRDLYRQRIGREHRLLFRLHPRELEVVDLVPRKDLERTIRELS